MLKRNRLFAAVIQGGELVLTSFLDVDIESKSDAMTAWSQNDSDVLVYSDQRELSRRLDSMNLDSSLARLVTRFLPGLDPVGGRSLNILFEDWTGTKEELISALEAACDAGWVLMVPPFRLFWLTNDLIGRVVDEGGDEIMYYRFFMR